MKKFPFSFHWFAYCSLGVASPVFAQNMDFPVRSEAVAESPVADLFEGPCGSALKENARELVASEAFRCQWLASFLVEHPELACEAIKGVIRLVSATDEEVATLVEASILAAPDQMRLISQCAIACAPDALPLVQAILAKLDPNGGETGSSAKSAKSSKGSKAVQGPATREQGNPLDWPGFTPLLPIVGTLVPPPVNPPPVTEVDPCRR